MGQSSSQDQVIACLGKSIGGLLGRCCTDTDRTDHLAPAGLFGQTAQFGGKRGEQQARVDGLSEHQAHRLITELDTHFRLREKLEKVGHRAGQPNFDDPTGHRADIADLGKIETKGSALQLPHPPLQRIAYRLCGQPVAAGEIEFVDPEDVAGASVGNDPAFGHTGHDLSAWIETDQSRRQRGANMLARMAEPDSLRFQIFGLGNERNVHDPVVLTHAARSEREGQQCRDDSAHDCRLAASRARVSGQLQLADSRRVGGRRGGERSLA